MAGVPFCSRWSFLLHSGAWLALLLAFTTATRTLKQGTTSCGEFIEDIDIQPNTANIPDAGGPTESNEECLSLCKEVPGCNVMVRASSGACFLKSIDVGTIESASVPEKTSFLVCPEPPPDEITPDDEVQYAICDMLMPDTDVLPSVGNIEGSGTETASIVACLALCTDTPPCNTMIRTLSGACFLKNVDTSSDIPIAKKEGSTSFVSCEAPPMTPPPSAGIAEKGKWGPVIKFPIVPVAVAALPDGKVLAWSADSVDSFQPNFGTPGTTFYCVFDSNDDSVAPLQSVSFGHDMFCPGIAMLPSGDVLVVAGSTGGDGADKTTTWNGNAFVEGPNLKIARGYNSAVTLSNGQVDKSGEMYNGATWTIMAGVSADANILSDDPQSDPTGGFRNDNYPHLFAWTGNSVFHAGPSTQMNWFTGMGGDGTSTPAGDRGPTAMNGNAVMYDAGKILTVGGAPSFSLGDVARKGAEVITLGAVGAAPTVQSVPGPKLSRTYALSVVLPTGEVAHLGGSKLAVEFSDAAAVFETEIWDPATEEWTTDASAAVPRTYHSSAVLVPDGRVFVGGGGLCGDCGVNHLDAEMYSPRYLFNADNTPATRPTVSLDKDTAGPGDSVTVTASEALSMVAMVRMGGQTHSTNTDQRRLELCGPSSTACGGATPSLTIPGAGIAIPGPWMVFGVNQAGIVSVAAILNVA